MDHHSNGESAQSKISFFCSPVYVLKVETQESFCVPAQNPSNSWENGLRVKRDLMDQRIACGIAEIKKSFKFI